MTPAVALGRPLWGAVVLGPNWGCNSTSLHMWTKWHRTVHMLVCVKPCVGHGAIIM